MPIKPMPQVSCTMAFEVYGIVLPLGYYVLPRTAPSKVHVHVHVHNSPWVVQIPYTSKAMVQLLHVHVYTYMYNIHVVMDKCT